MVRADRAGAHVPAHAAFPKWQEGRHPHCHFRGLLRLHSRYGPPDCSAAHRRPLSRGSSPPGYPHEPLVSYRINRQLSGWILPPLTIRAFGRTADRRHGHFRDIRNGTNLFVPVPIGFRGGTGMRLPRRRLLYLAAVALAALPRTANAEAYPSRPVRIIVGFAPGGGTDIMARLIGSWLSNRLGRQVVVENRPGAGTNIATEAVVRAPADGYMLLLAC